MSCLVPDVPHADGFSCEESRRCFRPLLAESWGWQPMPVGSMPVVEVIPERRCRAALVRVGVSNT